MLVIAGLLLISVASAITYNIESGDSITFQLEESYDYYSIVGNASPVDLEITNDGLNVTIFTNKYSPSDNFEIIFFNKEKEVVGSRGTRRVYVENKTIEYVEIEKIIEIGPEEPPEKEKPIWWLIFSIFLIVVIIALILTLRKKRKRNKK